MRPHALWPGLVAPAALAAAALAAGCGSSGGSAGTTPAGAGAPAQVKIVEAGSSKVFDPSTIYTRDAPDVVTIISVFPPGALGSLLGGGGTQAAQGSGFVVSAAGEIVTNAHVVTNGTGASLRRASSVYVKFADGNEVPAKIVGADPNADVALLRVDPRGLALAPLRLGSSSSVVVGAPVAALGSPFGQQGSLSVGVISATNRSIQSLNGSSAGLGGFAITRAIQTDAAINHGNSGGPLVDASGAVIGINSQIDSSSGGGSGVGFAVPVDAVKHSLAQLREHGSVAYAFLGVSSVSLFPQLAARLGLNAAQGALLERVNAGGPGARAGLRGGSNRLQFDAQLYLVGGDVITKLNGSALNQGFNLADAISQLRPGQVVTLDVLSGGSPKVVKVTLGARPNSGG